MITFSHFQFQTYSWASFFSLSPLTSNDPLRLQPIFSSQVQLYSCWVTRWLIQLYPCSLRLHFSFPNQSNWSLIKQKKTFNNFTDEEEWDEQGNRIDGNSNFASLLIHHFMSLNIVRIFGLFNFNYSFAFIFYLLFLSLCLLEKPFDVIFDQIGKHD